jgi:hypothetical protein
MGYALIWSEGLAAALFAAALIAAWAARGRALRLLGIALVFLVFFAPAALLVLWSYANSLGDHGHLIRTTWFAYAFSWLAAFTLCSVLVWRCGLRRPGAEQARTAAGWPRGKLWLGFGGAALALAFTLWNLDLGARADLAIARQEAGAMLLRLTPPPVADADNAARLYADAVKDLGEPLADAWREAALRGLDAREKVDWKSPQIAELVKKRQDALALLRKAAAMPRCSFAVERTLLADANIHATARKLHRDGVAFLAADARVQAAQGNLPRAFEDVTAMLGILRHASAELGLVWGGEVAAWRTLEDVLRLTPPGKDQLPALDAPELPALVRKVREEQALLGMVLPVALSQPSLVLETIRKNDGPTAALALEAAVVPARVFFSSDELAVMHKLLDDYQKSPPSPREESPRDWAELRTSVESDPTTIYGATYLKPKFEVLLAAGSQLAALRQTSRTGLAAAAYRRKYGQYPERLEQLAPEFLPALPVDPRDGQPLRLRRVGDLLVVYAPQDAAEVEEGKVRHPERREPPPIFRLSAAPAETP